MRHVGEKICVLGLGYVGFPLFVGLAEAGADVIGFDISEIHIANLLADRLLAEELNQREVDLQMLDARMSANEAWLADRNVYIVCVPTPVDKYKKPLLKPLEQVCDQIGKFLTRGDLVIFESTGFPGLVENVCLPIVETASGLTRDIDFSFGYAPERINPGDKAHTAQTVTKVVAGSSPTITEQMADLYSCALGCNVHRAESIKVAELSKVFENIQRDVNIALVNEIWTIASQMDINISHVLRCASTKWNFLPFVPGLVGGHCIGVDPYYLLERCEQELIAAPVIGTARETNEGLCQALSFAIMKHMRKHNYTKCIMLGITFKPECSDVRNSKPLEILHAISEHFLVRYHDPYVPSDTAVKIEFFDLSENKLDSLGLDTLVVVGTWHPEYEKLIRDVGSKPNLFSLIPCISIPEVKTFI